MFLFMDGPLALTRIASIMDLAILIHMPLPYSWRMLSCVNGLDFKATDIRDTETYHQPTGVLLEGHLFPVSRQVL